MGAVANDAIAPYSVIPRVVAESTVLASASCTAWILRLRAE